MLSGAAGGAIVLAIHGTGNQAATTTGRQPVPPVAGPGKAAAIDATRLAAAIGPAVVNINTRLDALEGGGRAAGTGRIVSRNGEIVTNNHVVEGADSVAVTIRGRAPTPRR
jgi:putative serine protease PepD